MVDASKKAPDLTLRLGVLVRDDLTGIEGIVSNCTHHISGVVQWTVQPYSDNKKDMKDGYNIDGDMLTVLSEGLAARVKSAPEAIHVALGDYVQDTKTEFKGTATSMSVYMNGCLFIGVTPQMTGREMFNSQPKESLIHYKQLIVLQDTETAAPMPANVTKQGDVYSTPPDGGPSKRVSANRVSRM